MFAEMVIQSFQSIFRVLTHLWSILSSGAWLPPSDKDLDEQQPGLTVTSEWADGCLCKLHLHEHIVDWSSMVSSCTRMLSLVLSFPLNCWVTVPCHPPWPFPFSLLCSVILPPISPIQSPKSLSFLFFSHFTFISSLHHSDWLSELRAGGVVWVKIHGPVEG